jgi:hypothetical protein
MEDNTTPVIEPPVIEPPADLAAQLLADDTTSQPYVGRWNQLVSTTNWEKGRIIHEWREALIEADADNSLYADEVWSRTVGAVTPQHVGRLRRVFERFDDVCKQYEGLFWSHFQAALDWEDAEMWLEGGVQNKWSVAQMRRQRWEALGADESLKPRDEDIIVSELNEDIDPLLDGKPSGTPDVIAPEQADVASVAPEDVVEDAAGHPTSVAQETDAQTATPVRPFEELPELPEDVADAFESMKLAILHHKAIEWEDIAQNDLLVVLDSLKELAMAPA